MEIYVQLKNAFPGGIGNRRIRLATICGLPPTPRRWDVFEGKFDNGIFTFILRCFQFNFLRPINYAFDRLDWTTGRWCTPNMSVVCPSSGVCHRVAVWQPVQPDAGDEIIISANR